MIDLDILLFFLSAITMMVNDANPWEVDAVTAFSYFCCPECEFKTKTVPSFLSHAHENHPRSKTFYSTQLEEEENMDSKVKYESEMKENLIFDDPNDLTYTPNPGHNQDLLELIGDFKSEFEENEEPLAKRKRRTKGKVKAEEVPEEGDEISCATCDSKFTSIYDLCIHNLDEHQEDKDMYICPICNHSTRGGKKCIKDHIKRKHETSRVSCPECNRLIKETTLIAHMASSHSGKSEKKYKCTYEDCEFESNNATSVANHIKYMHPSDSMQHPFACDKCAKTFPYASGLQQHVDKVHLKLKSFICEQCGKGFNSRIEFNEHQALPNCNFMSSTDVIFNCDKCQDTFNTVKGYIRHHEVLHGDFPPNLPIDSTYMCDECPKIYLKQRTLELHKKRVHRGTLPKSNNR